jgi:splicing factor 1
MQIMLANAGTVAHSDPQLQRLHDQLNELNRKITAGELDIPPEHDRSPSPEPIYDANGCRLNTREIRSVNMSLLGRAEGAVCVDCN